MDPLSLIFAVVIADLLSGKKGGNGQAAPPAARIKPTDGGATASTQATTQASAPQPTVDMSKPFPTQVPPTLPAFPGGWEADIPPPPEVQKRAYELIPTLWAKGAGSTAQELTGGRWVTYQAAMTTKPKDGGGTETLKGVTAYRVTGTGAVQSQAATTTPAPGAAPQVTPTTTTATSAAPIATQVSLTPVQQAAVAMNDALAAHGYKKADQGIYIAFQRAVQPGVKPDGFPGKGTMGLLDAVLAPIDVTTASVPRYPWKTAGGWGGTNAPTLASWNAPVTAASVTVGKHGKKPKGKKKRPGAPTGQTAPDGGGGDGASDGGDGGPPPGASSPGAAAPDPGETPPSDESPQEGSPQAVGFHFKMPSWHGINPLDAIPMYAAAHAAYVLLKKKHKAAKTPAAKLAIEQAMLPHMATMQAHHDKAAPPTGQTAPGARPDDGQGDGDDAAPGAPTGQLSPDTAALVGALAEENARGYTSGGGVTTSHVRADPEAYPHHEPTGREDMVEEYADRNPNPGEGPDERGYDA